MMSFAGFFVLFLQTAVRVKMASANFVTHRGKAKRICSRTKRRQKKLAQDIPMISKQRRRTPPRARLPVNPGE